ncbi:DinB family protein [Paenibacillus thalictri]|uniref:DinB family protein n=2 Tax=Paenibacillus thalictri TaxID=2527873 RepID=A0A4Q9DU12_9BACL|nr:DinB family protein [Paenibacillus thalictri]
MSNKQAVQSVETTLEQIIAIAEKLPDEVVRYKPAEDKWSVLEVLCHLEEALPYWLEEIQRVVAAPGSEWGRGLTHEGRLQAVAEANSRSLDDVLPKLGAVKRLIRETLTSISEEALQQQAPSRNPRFGTKPLQFIVDHLLVEHAATHLAQINRNIHQYNESHSTQK